MNDTLLERFLRYVSYETTSDPASEDTPSTPGQLKLAALLKKELSDLGWEARCGADGYVYASLPASKGCEKAPAIGFVSHMDTSDAVSGKNVKTKIVENYDGKDVLLEGSGDILSPEAYPELKKYVGKTLIVTDGTTLLGADDKAGVAGIMEMARRLAEDPTLPHGPVKIGFTPDEEIGRGADLFDVEGFGADFAYTVDGGGEGGLEYENFNAASAILTVHGQSIHPGAGKGHMKNAILMGMEFDRMLMSDDFINPVRHLNTKHIHPTMRNAKIIAPFFEDVTPEEMQRSLKSMIFYHKLFLVPEPAKRKALFMAMKAIGKYDALHGIVMSLEPNPACREYCMLLKRLYAGAVPLAASLILQFQKRLFNGQQLPERFHRTFGAGTDWEKLRL